MSDIFNNLDERQLKAVKSLHGPNLVVAGPGSGKTRVLTVKAANLILNGVDPSSIILFTFTNKAAKEIAERVRSAVGPKAYDITIGTYHSVCRRTLKLYAEKLGYKSRFTVIDTDEQKKILTRICKDSGITVKTVIQYISEQKKNLKSPQLALVEARGIDEKKAQFYEAYQRTLKKQNAMDYDDLIFNMVKLLQEFSSVKEAINQQYRYIIADEFHDSSPLDITLIDLLAGDSKNLTLIEDPDQSIYAFRGASIEASMEYAKSLNPATFYLDQNYRSSGTIVEAAKTLIEHNEKLADKNPFSCKAIGDKIIVYEGKTQKEEATRIVQFINLVHGDEYKVPYKEIAVLYRTTACTKAIEEALILAGIPYHITNGCPFMSRMEIKDILSFIRLAYNSYDYEAYERAIQIPKRGIGASTIQKIYNYAVDNDLDLIEASLEFETSKKSKQALKTFAEFILTLKNQYLYSNTADCINYILDQTKYYDTLSKDENVEARIENIQKFHEICSEYPNVAEMLEMCAFYTDVEENPEMDKVNLMTLHVSKGLEYDCVFICNFNEGSLPHVRCVTPKEIEEERRLCFVGITRSRKFLFLTRPKMLINGYQKQYPKVSRFLEEINPKYLFVTK